jgi:hypothetical protein
MRIDPDHVANVIGGEQQMRQSRTALLPFSLLAVTSKRMLLTADRSTTSRSAPLTSGGEHSYQVRPILEGKNQCRHFVSKTPTPGSQSAFESDLDSAFDPTRTVARAGTEHSTPGVLSSLPPGEPTIDLPGRLLNASDAA